MGGGTFRVAITVRNDPDVGVSKLSGVSRDSGAAPQDPTVGLSRGTCGGLRGVGAVSYERGTPVRSSNQPWWPRRAMLERDFITAEPVPAATFWEGLGFEVLNFRVEGFEFRVQC